MDVIFPCVLVELVSLCFVKTPKCLFDYFLYFKLELSAKCICQTWKLPMMPSPQKSEIFPQNAQNTLFA